MKNLTYDDNKFVWLGGYKSRFIPRSAGFQFDHTFKRWWTDDPRYAYQLRRYADSTAKAELGIHYSTEIPEYQRLAIHSCLRLLSSMCDGAKMLDGEGFSKSDTGTGRHLASLPSLTSEQATLGLGIVSLHRYQLPKGLVVVALGKEKQDV